MSTAEFSLCVCRAQSLSAVLTELAFLLFIKFKVNPTHLVIYFLNAIVCLYPSVVPYFATFN
jgi:hypothetical protein